MDLSVGFGRQPRHRRQPAGRHFAHSISIGDGLDWDCPLSSSLSPIPPRGRCRACPAPLPYGSGRVGAGPRATAESLIPVRPSFLGLTGVKDGATARTGGRREGPRLPGHRRARSTAPARRGAFAGQVKPLWIHQILVLSTTASTAFPSRPVTAIALVSRIRPLQCSGSGAPAPAAGIAPAARP